MELVNFGDVIDLNQEEYLVMEGLVPISDLLLKYLIVYGCLLNFQRRQTSQISNIDCKERQCIYV